MEGTPPPYRYASSRDEEAMLLNNLLTKSCYSKDPVFSPILRGGCPAACVYIPSMNDYYASQWTYNDYMVGVVCTMGFEMSAIRYMLDDKNFYLPTKQGDSNLYVLSKLSSHNVVLVCLLGT